MANRIAGLWVGTARKQDMVATSHPAASGGDTQDFRRDVDQFYKACHMPQPALVVTNSRSRYLESLDVLNGQARGSGAFGYTENSIELLIMAVLSSIALAVVVNVVVMCLRDVGSVFHWCTPLDDNAGRAIMSNTGLLTAAAWVLAFLVAVVHVTLGARANKRLLAAGLVAGPALPGFVGLRGASTTHNTMVGCLTSAIRTAGFADSPGQETRITGENQRRDSCLRFGSNRLGKPSSFARIAWMSQSIMDATIAMADTSQSRGLSRPLVLEQACTLCSLVDEVSLFEGVVLVLARDSLDDIKPDIAVVPAPPPVSLYDLDVFDTSVRFAARDALGRPGREKVPRFVKSLWTWPNLAQRDIAYRMVGLDQVVSILKVKPHVEDSAGQLYRLGTGSMVVCYVRVQDKVVDGDNKPLVHWVCVPQHIATPREGVAWSFDLGARDYAPTQEA